MSWAEDGFYQVLSKMKKNFFSVLFFVIGVVIFSCENKEVEPSNILEGTEYFPLEKGVYAIYKINETKYSSISGNATSEYFLKELISDTITDSYNNVMYEVKRFVKNTEIDEWELDSVWSERKSGNQFVKKENNVEFVKLVVPVKEGKEWNGNVFNDRGEEIYSMESIHQPYTVNDVLFDSTLTQIQKQDSSSVSQDYRTEVYAKGVGLIYKKSIITSNRQENGSIIFPIEIDNGIDFTQTIIEYGKE